MIRGQIFILKAAIVLSLGSAAAGADTGATPASLPDAAVATWTRLTREYPNTIEADSSALFISVVYRWMNRPDDAKKVLKDFLAKHPRSPVAQAAREQLAKLGAPPDHEQELARPEDNQKGTTGQRMDQSPKKAK